MDTTMKNATVEYQDGLTETFDVIQIVQRGALIGRMIQDDTTNTSEFLICGFIPKTSIRQIKNSDQEKNNEKVPKI